MRFDRKGPMPHVICTSCRVRFARAAAASLPSCPTCGGSLASVDAEHAFGHPLAPAAAPTALPDAASAVLPVPPLRGPDAL
jgi:predicted  nucleic acid-binding Zn-ribbon protein